MRPHSMPPSPACTRRRWTRTARLRSTSTNCGPSWPLKPPSCSRPVAGRPIVRGWQKSSSTTRPTRGRRETRCGDDRFAASPPAGRRVTHPIDAHRGDAIAVDEWFGLPADPSAKDKLAGAQLANFGAFFSAKWRGNDWMWGRLDAAQGLVDLLTDSSRWFAESVSWDRCLRSCPESSPGDRRLRLDAHFAAEWEAAWTRSPPSSSTPLPSRPCPSSESDEAHPAPSDSGRPRAEHAARRLRPR